eukprot:evm.model.scf_379.6 EVM.evm.TU.scf_379.6   scf_379:44311-46606(+)
MPYPQLYSLRMSPRSFKAAWALRHCKIDYTSVGYLPGFSEPWLRWKLGKFGGRVTVPTLFMDKGHSIMDSFDIAVWADEHRHPDTKTLFPNGLDAARQWNDQGELVLNLQRVRSIGKCLRDEEAMAALTPPSVRPLGPIGVALARWSAGRVVSKYSEVEGARSEDASWGVLEELRAALKKRASEAPGAECVYITGEYSYADIIMSTVVEVVAPSPPQTSPLPKDPAVAKCFLWKEAATEFGDLLAWRDAVFKRHGYWRT